MSHRSYDTQKGKIVALTRLPSPREIKTLRQHLGLSATEFGKRFGCSRSQIKHLEGGSKRPNKKFVEQFWRERNTTPRTTTRLIASVDLPGLIYVEAEPRTCRGHDHAYFWADTRRVYCKVNHGECRKLWLRKLKEEDPNASAVHHRRRRHLRNDSRSHRDTRQHAGARRKGKVKNGRP
jgi:transcriptional regulator with XRE-family HTH domain